MATQRPIQMPAQSELQEIEDSAKLMLLLQMAITQRWNFDYSILTNSRLSTHTTRLLGADLDARTITVGSEVKYSGLHPEQIVNFRTQHGGLSLEFSTQLVPSGSNALSSRLFSECKMVFPQTVMTSQLRNALRIDCSRIDRAEVTLFGSEPRQDGVIVNLSSTGCKIQLKGDVREQIKSMGKLIDCQLQLPDEESIDARVIVLHSSFEKVLDATLLRCYFLEIHRDSKLKVEKLIAKALRRQSQHTFHF